MPHTIDQFHIPKEQYLQGKAAGTCWARSGIDYQRIAAAAALAEFVRVHPYQDDWLTIGAQMLKVRRDQLDQIHGFWHQVAGTDEPTNPFVAGFLNGAEEVRNQPAA